MPTQKISSKQSKSKAKSKSNTKSRLDKTSLTAKSSMKSWMAIPIIALVALTGYIVVTFSHASGSPTSSYGRASKLPAFSAAVKSPSGDICFTTYFKTPYSPVNGSYKGELQRYYNGSGWGAVYTSPRYQANGKKDHYCWGDAPGTSYLRGHLYRVKFYNSGLGGSSGDFSVWGYKHN